MLLVRGTNTVMPEVVEVEIVARGLRKEIVNRTITGVKSDSNPRFSDSDKIKNCTITMVERRGKYLICTLNGNKTMIIHLGMTGQLLYNSEVTSNIRAIFAIGKDTLTLRDPRGFGRVRVISSGEDHGLATLTKLGPEYNDPAFTSEHIHSTIGTSTVGIKSLLLNQQILAGVGNYICDEALHRAKINPTRARLDLSQCVKLHESLLHVIRSSLECGGVSVRDYVHIDGTKGHYQNSFSVYGRGGEKCFTCGSILGRSVVAGRTTVHCVSCQK